MWALVASSAREFLLCMDIDTNKKQDKPQFKTAPIALEVGFSIAMPIVIFALIGRFIDNQFGTSPVVLLVGIGLSVFVSSYIIWRKMKNYF